jgi:renalase
MKHKIAIIGAGLSGLVTAHALAKVADIDVFEKSRGLGGRLSTRYADPFQFDHGAQFFTAKTPAFQQWLKPLQEAGVVQQWDARFVDIQDHKITRTETWNDHNPHYVGSPKMNQIGKYLSADLNIHKQTKIETIRGEPQRWFLTDDAGAQHGPYDWVICATPAQQAAELLPSMFLNLLHVQNTKLTGCFTLMLGFDEPLPLDWDAACVTQSDISWISVNSSKPERPEGFSLCVLSTNPWAETHMEDNIEHIKAHLLEQASVVVGHDLSHASHISIHRWRYANSPKQPDKLSLIDTTQGLAACGDWCIEGRVEAAFTSALELSAQIRESL